MSTYHHRARRPTLVVRYQLKEMEVLDGDRSYAYYELYPFAFVCVLL